MANDPLGAGRNMLDAFAKDPSEGLGRLVPELIGTKGLGAAREGMAAARYARRGEDAARAALRKEGAHPFGREDAGKTCKGTDPVNLATGKMFLPQTDLAVPGELPLVFRRRVESGYPAGGWFGPSWSSTADQRLEIDAEGVVFISEDGLLLPYPHPAPGLPTLPRGGPAVAARTGRPRRLRPHRPHHRTHLPLHATGSRGQPGSRIEAATSSRAAGRETARHIGGALTLA